MTPRRLVARVCCALGLAFGSFVSGQPRDTLVPFALNHRETAGTRIDLSLLLAPPAGKDGFIRVQGGHLATPAGQPVRFWGVNLTDWSPGSVMIPPKQDAPVWAATLARFGVNCVRLHFLDLDAPRGLLDRTRQDSREFDAEQLDREDFFIAQLKRRGIYVDLNLNVGRSYKAQDGVRDHDQIRWAKGLTLFDPRLVELQKEYATRLLTHRNPYTNTEYRHEPAVAIVEIANENALYVGFRAPTAYYEDALTRIYNDWLRATVAPERLSALRTLAGTTGDQPVPRLQRAEAASAPKERFDLEAAFYSELESRFFRDMQAFFKDTLGVKSPIVGTADHSHSGSSYALLRSTSLLDIVDGHTYWQHPGPHGMPNTPMVNDPSHSTVVELSRTAFVGKPYMVSEVNHPYPNEWASEGIPILAAYAAFQGWDAVFWYTFEPKRAADWQGYMGDPFDISHDPIKMPQLASGALMFLRGDVKEARETVERSYSRAQVDDSLRLPESERPYFTPGFPLLLPLVHGSRIRALDGAPTQPFVAPAVDPIVADTGEITWHLSADKKGLVAVDTERSQALIGNLAEHRQGVANLAVDVKNAFGSIVLSSLDGQSISKSRHLLLTAGARAVNTRTQWNETRTALVNWGGPPSMIEPLTGTILLRGFDQAKHVRTTALDGAGRPLGAAQLATWTKEGWRIAIGEPATTWYEITVE